MQTKPSHGLNGGRSKKYKLFNVGRYFLQLWPSNKELTRVPHYN